MRWAERSSHETVGRKWSLARGLRLMPFVMPSSRSLRSSKLRSRVKPCEVEFLPRDMGAHSSGELNTVTQGHINARGD
jgi:hypothetical protein